MATNDYVSTATCDAYRTGQDDRIDAVDRRVTTMGADVDRRFNEMATWVRELSSDQKRFFWLALTSALASVGALAGIVVQLLMRAN